MDNNVLQHNYLAIPLPSDWEDASQVIALGPEENGFRVNLVFSQEPTNFGETSEEFAKRQLPQLEQALENYRLIEDRSATFGLNSGYLRHHTFSMDRGEIGQLQFYCVIGGRAYTFTFTHLKDMLKNLQPVAEKMFAGARIAPPPPNPYDEDF